MSEPFITPEPDNSDDALSNASAPIDFSTLNIEETGESLFTPPNAKAGKGKRKWWQSKPKGNRNTRQRKTPSVKPMPKGGLKPALAQLYAGIGMSVMPFDASCGRVIIENADSCAQSLDDLAKTNPALRNLLISLVTTSAYGAVIMAHAPIIMAIAMHHVPALRDRQEKMVGEFAEMMANMGSAKTQEDDSE